MHVIYLNTVFPAHTIAQMTLVLIMYYLYKTFTSWKSNVSLKICKSTYGVEKTLREQSTPSQWRRIPQKAQSNGLQLLPRDPKRVLQGARDAKMRLPLVIWRICAFHQLGIFSASFKLRYDVYCYSYTFLFCHLKREAMVGLAAKTWYIRKKDGVQFCWSVLLCHMAAGKKEHLISLLHPSRQYMSSCIREGFNQCLHF